MFEVNLLKVFQMGNHKYIISLKLSVKLLRMKYSASRKTIDYFGSPYCYIHPKLRHECSIPQRFLQRFFLLLSHSFPRCLRGWTRVGGLTLRARCCRGSAGPTSLPGLLPAWFLPQL